MSAGPDVTPDVLFSSQEKIHQLYQELSISDTDPQIRVQVENVLSSLLGEVRQLQDENKHMEKLYIRYVTLDSCAFSLCFAFE